MINSWSELFQAIKTWFNTELKIERKKRESAITQTDLDNIKKIEDLMYAPKRFDWDSYYNKPSYQRDPYYQNLRKDDSMWEDQIQQEVKDALTRIQDTDDPTEREKRRQELIKKLRAKYGLDHP